jgi:sulfopyruvate decarboxylase TPP-binding subunit
MSASEFVAEIRITNAETGSILAAGSFAAGEVPRILF